ncbi:hypothetical protein PIB30_038401 [Stylosanthes scabra]|uniref:Uncharacterized protein n=1 Tax=Stylosanthes scabra TaxID=79078 RepID=A0ABU6TDR0_9FABA|nr:hypothetical protein [Stylosanthes scabra]
MNWMCMGCCISSAPWLLRRKREEHGRGTCRRCQKRKKSLKERRARTPKLRANSATSLASLISLVQEMALTLSKFMKLYNTRSPGIKKDDIWEKNLNALLRGKTSIGFPEVARILSPEFGQEGAISAKDSNMDSQYNTKGKGSQKKGKSSKK